MKHQFLNSTNDRIALQGASARAVHHEFANAFQVVMAHLQLGRSGEPTAAASFQASALAELTARIACGVQHWVNEGDLRCAINHSTDVFAPLCDARNVAFVVDEGNACRQHEGVVPFPSWPVEAILVCLISNSLKAVSQSSDGPARIDVRTKWLGDRVRIEVADNGCGMSARDLHWVGREGRSRLGGRGLGLSISRDISRRLGGILGLSSDVNRGTRVELVLPARLHVQAAS